MKAWAIKKNKRIDIGYICSEKKDYILAKDEKWVRVEIKEI